jgi:MarR family transcriptional regulator, lower aerobic nicotinate degradation pathway regulator
MSTIPKRQKVLESFSRMPGHLIRRVHQVSTAYFTEECGPDLTAVQYAALVAIGSNPYIDATRLSQIIYFDRSTIGDVLDRIESKGWIVRQATASDRRVKLLTLAPAGEDVLRQVMPAIRRVQERLLAPLTPGEAKTMVRLLMKMADAAGGEGDAD